MPLAVMFCTASLSTFLFLTFACTRWSKQAVFFTLVLNCKGKKDGREGGGVQNKTQKTFSKHSFHSVERQATRHPLLSRSSSTWPWLRPINRHIHQVVLITSFSRRNDLVPMETRLCCVRTRSCRSNIFFFFYLIKRDLLIPSLQHTHTHTQTILRSPNALLSSSAAAPPV